MDWLPEAAKALEKLNSRMVLMAVGVLLIALTVSRVGARRKESFGTWLGENLQVVLSVVVVVFLIIRPFLFQAFYIPSTSMEPTLHGPPMHAVGDRLIANKLIYLISDPKRYDIAVFYAPPFVTVEESEFIKRVIGLPNETVEVVPPRLLAGEKVAFRFGNPEVGSKGQIIPLAPQSELNVAPDGMSADVAIGDAGNSFRILAIPNPKVRFDAYQVEIGGKVELQDINGLIESRDDLTEYGAAPEVRGTVYLIDGEPRLAVLDAETLRYDPGHVMVDGKRLEERYIAEPPKYEYGPRTLDAQEYFMLGDNRNGSNDSHAWGPLTRDRMIGRAEIIFWPLNRLTLFHGWLLIALAVLCGLYYSALRILGR